MVGVIYVHIKEILALLQASLLPTAPQNKRALLFFIFGQCCPYSSLWSNNFLLYHQS